MNVHRVFEKFVDLKVLSNLAIVFGLCFVLQLRYSQRARNWAKSFLIGLVTGGTAIGVLVVAVLALIKLKLKTSKP